jgi:transcriptional regulator with XRE-family HTH domain
LRTIRTQKELRQEDVAKGMRISRSQYSAIENAQSVVNFNHLLALSRVLRIPLAQMMTLENADATAKG